VGGMCLRLSPIKIDSQLSLKFLQFAGLNQISLQYYTPPEFRICYFNSARLSVGPLSLFFTSNLLSGGNAWSSRLFANLIWFLSLVVDSALLSLFDSGLLVQ
jgi:hypothetical protein